MKTTFEIKVKETGDVLEDGTLTKKDAIAAIARLFN